MFWLDFVKLILHEGSTACLFAVHKCVGNLQSTIIVLRIL